MAADPKRLTRARESWLADENPEHYGDAMLLCQMAASGSCGEDGHCKLDGFCFRGLASAEVRRGFEVRLALLEREMRKLMVCALPQRLDALAKIRQQELDDIKGVVLHFRGKNAPQ